MDGGQASTSYRAPAPLFPAYSSDVQNQDDKKEWLQNSSFSASAFKEVCSQLSCQDAEKSPTIADTLVELPVKVKNKNKSHKKKKYEKYADPSAFAVPESDSIICQLKKKTFIEETGLSLERAFVTDARRDPENLMFESFERTKVAHYYSRLKIPVGLTSKELSLFHLSLPKKKEKISRYFGKKFQKNLKATESEKVCVNKEPLENVSLNYIPILPSSSSSVQAEKCTLDPNFMNISSSWKTEFSKKEVINKDKNLVESISDEFRDKVIYYNKKLSEEPHNVDIWMEFLDFQDQMFLSENCKKSQVLTERSVIEKKISILEKALKYNPKNVLVNVTRLKLCQHLCSSDELSSMWDNLIFIYPNDACIWQEYLLYSMSNLSTFNVAHILKLYSKCLRTLSSISEGESQSHHSSPDTVPNMLEIFNQLCYILKSCGYTEKVVAAYQALIEFNLFCDPSIENLPIDEKITCLEPFWDSGAARVGEKEALGWATTVRLKKISSDYISTDSDLNNMEDDILSKKLSHSETWLEFEKLREMHHWLPWKPNPEYDQTSDDIDDPDRTVSFDDVSKFLFCVQSEEYKFLLLLQFINFFGFDPHSMSCYNFRNKVISNLYNVDDFEKILHQVNQTRLIHPFANPFPSTKLHCDKVKYNFISNIFSQVIEKFSAKFKILCTCLRVKFQQYFITRLSNENDKKNISDLRKFVKGILKKPENRNCLLLWIEYIYIEWLTDKSNALKTFRSLLVSSMSAVSDGSMQLRELWHFIQSFFELYLNDKETSSSNILSTNEIMWILIHVGCREKYVPYSIQDIKPTMILKATSGFKSVLEKEFNSLGSSALCYCLDPCEYSVINCAKCFAYFQYFSNGIQAALHVYDSVTYFISSNVAGHFGSYISEQICTAQAKIFDFHTWNSVTSIKPLQMFLYDSVSKYPLNGQLLYTLVKLRSASSIMSPTRRFLSNILRNNHKTHPVTWLFALITEFAICSSLMLQNGEKDIGEELRDVVSGLGIHWRIRALYEKMLQCNACCHVSILWRSYLKFELMTQNTGRAKAVFHRALQNCGWCKDLLLDAVQYFPDELNEILAFMNEKQMRVHTPLEEVTLLMEHAAMDC